MLMDQPYHRGDGIIMPKDVETQPPYLTQGKDNVRAVVNRVKLPGQQNLRARSGSMESSSVRRSADGWVKMGGGFVYRSNIQVDPQRPTPSRPSYSHGLFLFPFSSEDAAKMQDAGEPKSWVNPHATPPLNVKDTTSGQASQRQGSSGGVDGRDESWNERGNQAGRARSAQEQGKQDSYAKTTSAHHDDRPRRDAEVDGHAYVVSISRNGDPGKQPPERHRAQS